MAKKQIFLVYSCDIWKSTDSMRLLMCTTSTCKVRSYIVEKIRDGTFTYGRGCEEKLSKCIALFRNDFDGAATRAEINSNLDFGFIDYCYDGEEI